MDGITPVGAEVQPPNIGQGLNTLSSILGLSQQQIAIKQQQQALAAQTAEAAQEQQKNSELQQAQQLSLSVKNGQFLNPDGTLDRQALADKLTQVGPYAQASANQVLAQANEIAQNRLAKQQLSQNVQNQLGQGLTGLASDPNTTPQDVKEWVSSQIAAHPNDPQFRDYMLSMAMHFPSQAPANVQHQILQRWAAEYSGQPLETPTQVNTGANLIPGATNRFTGAFSPSATGQPVASVPMQLTPSQQPSYLAAAGAASAGATARATGTAGIDVQRAQQIGNSLQSSSAMIPVTEEIDSLADQIHSGKFMGYLSELAAKAGESADTYARQLLVKDLGQVRSAAIRGAPSIEAADTILSGYPESTSDPQTIHTSMDLVRGAFRQNVERGQRLINYRQKDPTLTGFAQADDTFTHSQTPYMSEYRALSPQQRVGFLRRHFNNKDQAQAFENQALGVQ